MIQEILLNVLDHISTIQSFSYVGLDNGQLAKTDEPSVKFPCALLDMQNFEIEQHSQLGQTIKADLVVTIGTNHALTGSVKSKRTGEVQGSAFALVDELHAVLQGKRGNYAPLTRTAISRATPTFSGRDTVTVHYTTSFRCDLPEKVKPPKTEVSLQVGFQVE